MHVSFRTALPVVLTAIVLPSGLSAGAKQVPARLAQARYVALGYDLGDRFLSASEAIADPDVLPEDRRALAEIRDQIEKWNRYVITPRAGQAELLIAIRTGRRVTGGFGVPIGGPAIGRRRSFEAALTAWRLNKPAGRASRRTPRSRPSWES